ncbi:MAG: hypothetical protein LBV72_16725 [Tannerella sp.]|nr:hypothetical protein [Tannerella sp.]
MESFKYLKEEIGKFIQKNQSILNHCLGLGCIVVVTLLSVIFFTSCEDGYKHLQNNLGKYNTAESYLNGVYTGLEYAEQNPDGLKRKSDSLIEYVDGYLTQYSKDVPTSLADVTNIDNAALYYMSIIKQIALVASDYAGKIATLTDEEVEELYYRKFDLLADELAEAVERWADLQEAYAKKHNITLVDLSK